MGDLKIKQHYVWKKYLRAWTTDDKNIWVKMLKYSSVKEVPLASIAQEKKFYQLVDITDEEEKFIANFIDKMCHESLKPLLRDFLMSFTAHTKLRKQLDNLKLNPDDVKRKFIEEEINEVEMNMMENTHCIFENYGHKLTSCKTPADVFFMQDEDSFMETMLFLAVQYFRTKKMHINVSKEFEGNPYNLRPEKIWNIISFAMAAKFGRALALNPKLRVRIYDNRTDSNFLTNDQPIFNILGDSKDDDGNTTELELYYPITTKLAICLHFNNQPEKIKSIPVNTEVVKFFNDQMILNAEEFIFSQSESQLKEIKIS